jgi:D-glycero-D-manno-heptose 1,7-bisphosphate phosphatase
MRNKAVFLDRDGVINRAFLRNGRPYPPPCVQDVEIMPGVSEALTMLRQADYWLIVVTNQPDVARGVTGRAAVEEIHTFLADRLAIDEFLTCYHDDADCCGCRKPKPGLILAAAEKYKLNLSKSFMVGDRWRDIGAGQAAGCQSIFIDYQYQEKLPDPPFLKTTSLRAAVSLILENKNEID